jgi:hypothetical protein
LFGSVALENIGPVDAFGKAIKVCVANNFPAKEFSTQQPF